MFFNKFLTILSIVLIVFIFAEEDDAPCGEGGDYYYYKSSKSDGEIKSLLSKASKDALIWLDFSKKGKKAITGSIKPKIVYSDESGVERKENYLFAKGNEDFSAYFENGEGDAVIIEDLMTSDDKFDLAVFTVFSTEKDGEKDKYNNVSLFGEYSGGFFNLVGLNADNLFGGGMDQANGSDKIAWEVEDAEIEKKKIYVSAVYIKEKKVVAKIGGTKGSSKMKAGDKYYSKKLGFLTGRYPTSRWKGNVYELIVVPLKKIGGEKNINDILAALQSKWNPPKK